MEKYTLSVLVENNAGVLSRVVGLFTRRGFNIHSLSVGTTLDEHISRITIEVKGDVYMVEQVSKQLSKILEVIKIKTLKESEMVKRGLVLVKIKTRPRFTISDSLRVGNGKARSCSCKDKNKHKEQGRDNRGCKCIQSKYSRYFSIYHHSRDYRI